MRLQLTGFRFVSIAALTGLALAGLLYGQTRAATEKNETLRIRRFSGAGARNLVETPKYQVSTVLPNANRQAQRWGRIWTQYDTTPEWIDELTFQYFVLARKAEAGNKFSFSFYTVSVKYSDIKRGQHESSVFLRPVAIERYGDVIAAAVEIGAGGKLIAEESHAEGIKLQDRWWRIPAVVESKDVVTRTGYLLDREQSPFALINIDDQEAIRQ